MAGERDPAVLASYRDRRCHSSVETVRQALVGNIREEHIFALTQALELYDVYQAKVISYDGQIEAILKRLKKSAPPPASKLPSVGQKGRPPNAPAFDARAALHAILGVDLTQIHGLGPYLALKLAGECGTSLAAWPSAKHFTSWLVLAPHNKISGGKVLSSKTRRTSNRASSLLRLAALTEAVIALAPGGGPKAAACAAPGVSRASVQRRRARLSAQPVIVRRRPRPARAWTVPRQQMVLDLLHAPRFANQAPVEIYATLVDEGAYHCSIRTMYPLLGQNGEVRERRQQLRHPANQKPELLAEKPNEVWSWDITKLMGPTKWSYFYLDGILDIFSRRVAGWCVADAEKRHAVLAIVR